MHYTRLIEPKLTKKPQEKEKDIVWNRNKYCAILLIVLLIVLTAILFFSMYGWVAENSKLQQPRTFHIPFGADYGANAMSGSSYPYDFEIDLTITYPENTLMVGDVISINATAIVHNQPYDATIQRIIIGFENAQAVPFHQTDGITDALSMNLLPIGNNWYMATGKCLWETEGTYQMGINLVFSNSSGTFFFPTATAQGMAITVYPKTTSAQIFTNNASLTLTLAIYALTLIGTLSLFFTLWDRKSPATEQSLKEGNQSDAQPQKNDAKANNEANKGNSNTKQTKNKATHNKS